MFKLSCKYISKSEKGVKEEIFGKRVLALLDNT